jgi:hypothetical protein
VQWWLTASALWKAYVRERGTRRGERANWWAIEARTWAQRRAFAIDETDPRLPPTVRAYARRATGDVELAVSTTDVGWTPASVNRFVDDGIGRLRVVGPWNRAPFAEGLRRALTDAVLSDPANAEAVIARAEEAVSQLPPPVDAAFARVVADAFRVTDDDERAKEWRVRADALAAEHKPGPGRFDRDRGHERS